jgi:hypothetical protein
MFGNAKSAKKHGLRSCSDFYVSHQITNCASPLNSYPPGQGLKSSGNFFSSGFASTIQFLTAVSN